jgi:hypothetical protein
MSDLSIQFHALPGEIAAVLLPFVAQSGARLTLLRTAPFESFRVEPSMLESALQDVSVNRVVLTLTDPVLTQAGPNDFFERNASALVWEIGRRNDQGLQESWLWARTDDKHVLQIWRSFAKQLRAVTRKGVIAVNPKTGATGRLKEHRFTDGAKSLEREGVPMLPAAGTSRLRFED